MTQETDTLENEYVDNTKEQDRLNARNRNIVQLLIKAFHKVSVGDVVKYKGQDVKIQRLDILGLWGVYNRTSKPWIYGYLKKKDGKWSSQARCIYDKWELI